MKSSLKFEKKVLYILLGILCFLILPLIAIIFMLPGFRFRNFEEKIEISYGSEFHGFPGDVCYGNLFDCKEVEVELTNIEMDKLGEQEITYTYHYQEKTTQKKQVLVIVDQEGPEIIVDEEILYYCPNKTLQEYHMSARDNYNGELTDKVEIKVKENEVIFEVEDSSNNKTTKKIEAQEKDEENPQIWLNGDSIVSIALHSTYQEEGASAKDNCDGDITERVQISGSVDTSKTGEYKITYEVSDSKGNTSQVIRTIYVYQQNETVTPSGKVVYLTFDDGPGPYTEQLLNTLKKYNVKATFFVTDQGLTKGYDQMIKRAYEEGHSIGIHSQTHNYSIIYSSEEAYFQDLYAIQNKVKNITGYTTYLMRFPGGSSNTVSKNYDRGTHIMSQLTKAVEAKGFRYFDWNVSSGDAGETTITSEVSSNVIKGMMNRNPAVVLQHDVKSYSVNATEAIIQYGLSHGYQFLPLTMNSPTAHHNVNN